jgi:hypothetical protein
MDWARAIERNSEALKGILAALFAMLSLEGASGVLLPRPLHSAILGILRRAAVDRHRGEGPRGEAPCAASDAGGAHRPEDRVLAFCFPAHRSAQALRPRAP